MNNRIYYGEYTLKHWIDLMLKKNIVLPPYQRSFVWDENAVFRFVKSLKEHQFIPPVTIAHFTTDEQVNTNYILDGQQRLTSILLAFLGYYPNKENFKVAEMIGTEDDGAVDEETVIENIKKPIEWTFNELLKYSTPDIIKARLSVDSIYKKLKDLGISEEFFENTFIGFSYVIPETVDPKEIQRYYSMIFRNINYLGSTLSLLESRKSLYFLNDSFEKFFDAKTANNDDVLCDLKILDNMQPCKIDFVRYLSTLSQYSIKEDATEVMKGYSSYKSRENYYADYVSYLVGLEQENNIDKFNGFDFPSIFPNNIWENRFETLKNIISQLKSHMTLEKGDSFKSWIDADYWMFGLIYNILFKGKSFVIKTGLINDIKNAIEAKKADTAYSKSPNRLGYLRERLVDSIEIFNREYER